MYHPKTTKKKVAKFLKLRKTNTGQGNKPIPLQVFPLGGMIRNVFRLQIIGFLSQWMRRE